MLELAKSGNQSAIDQLTREYWPQAYRTARRILRSHEDAEEIAQDALWSAIRHLPKFREDASFRTWLHRIVINHSLMALRRRRSRGTDSTVPLTTDGFQGCADGPRTPEELLLEAERRAVLEEGMSGLPALYSVVLRLVARDDPSMRDIASSVGISTGAVKTRLHRGRDQLRRSITCRFEGASDSGTTGQKPTGWLWHRQCL